MFDSVTKVGSWWPRLCSVIASVGALGYVGYSNGGLWSEWRTEPTSPISLMGSHMMDKAISSSERDFTKSMYKRVSERPRKGNYLNCVYLGKSVDSEPSGFFTSDADGDDLAVWMMRMGVVFPELFRGDTVWRFRWW